MNLYIRYFDSETLVTNVADAIAFLAAIPEVGMNDKIANDIREYYESDMRFPKRYKVRPRIYFIMIKTTAATMEEFKSNRAESVSKANNPEQEPEPVQVAEPEMPEPQFEEPENQYEEPVNQFEEPVSQFVEPANQYEEPANKFEPGPEPLVPIEETPRMRREREQNSLLYNLHYEREGWYEGVVDFKRVVTNPATGKFEYRDCHFVARCKALSGFDCYNRIIDHLRTRVDNRSQFPSVKGKNFQFTYLGGFKQIQEN